MTTLIFGWIPPEERTAEETAIHNQCVADMPAFNIVGDFQAAEDVRLWKFLVKLLGKHNENIPQEIGDCTSWGTRNAVDFLAAVEIVQQGDAEEFKPSYPPYFYAASRVLVGGGRISGDGSVGSWCADALRRFGVAVWESTMRYSGDLARNWGRKGPPEEIKTQAVKHPVKTTAMVTTWEQVKAAITNGYPINVCSNQGFNMKQRLDGGKMWATPSGSWGHSMCICGLTLEPRPGAYILNSWGADAHSPPAGDEPPGGFWTDAKIIERMVSQEDSFAYSGFEGFPARDINWSLV